MQTNNTFVCVWLLKGMTRLLLTKIPFFKEIIVSSFACENCGWVNNEIQSAGKIQEQGVQYTLHASSTQVSLVNNPRLFYPIIIVCSNSIISLLPFSVLLLKLAAE